MQKKKELGTEMFEINHFLHLDNICSNPFSPYNASLILTVSLLGMYLEFKRNSVISGSSIVSRSSGHFYSTGNLASVERDHVLPDGLSTSSLDSTRSRFSKPTIDRTIKPMNASAGGSISSDGSPGCCQGFLDNT